MKKLYISTLQNKQSLFVAIVITVAALAIIFALPHVPNTY